MPVPLLVVNAIYSSSIRPDRSAGSRAGIGRNRVHIVVDRRHFGSGGKDFGVGREYIESGRKDIGVGGEHLEAGGRDFEAGRRYVGSGG
jgi:hypothetical protein